MQYIKVVKKSAKKFIDKQDKAERKRIYTAIDNLPERRYKEVEGI